MSRVAPRSCAGRSCRRWCARCPAPTFA